MFFFFVLVNNESPIQGTVQCTRQIDYDNVLLASKNGFNRLPLSVSFNILGIKDTAEAVIHQERD